MRFEVEIKTLRSLKYHNHSCSSRCDLCKLTTPENGKNSNNNKKCLDTTLMVVLCSFFFFLLFCVYCNFAISSCHFPPFSAMLRKAQTTWWIRIYIRKNCNHTEKKTIAMMNARKIKLMQLENLCMNNFPPSMMHFNKWNFFLRKH